MMTVVILLLSLNLAAVIVLGTVAMSKITDLDAAVKAALATVAEDLTGVTAKLAVLSDGITVLITKIGDLQNSPGALTPEDQAALDDIQNVANSVKLQADSTKAAADAVVIPEIPAPVQTPVTEPAPADPVPAPADPAPVATDPAPVAVDPTPTAPTV